MMGTAELLGRLTEDGVSRAQIAKVLGIHPSGVTRLFDGRRNLDLNEAVKLVEKFGLDVPVPAQPIPVPILRLCVIYIATEFGVPLHGAERKVAKLTEDLRAFSEYAADPTRRSSLEGAEGFFQALRFRRPFAEEADPPETNHDPVK